MVIITFNFQLSILNLNNSQLSTNQSFSQNSIFSLFGPSMVKNFTPFFQKGRPLTLVSSIFSPARCTTLNSSSMFFTSMAMWSMAPYAIAA